MENKKNRKTDQFLKSLKKLDEDFFADENYSKHNKPEHVSISPCQELDVESPDQSKEIMDDFHPQHYWKKDR